MKKTLILTLLLLLLPCSLKAGLRDTPFGQRMRFGVEMGWSPGFFTHHGYNFLSEDGYRLHDFRSGFKFSNNAYLEAMIAYGLSPRHQIALTGGYRGVSEDNRYYSIGAKYSFFYKSSDKDGFFNSVGLGTGFSSRMDIEMRTAYMASLSEGYRIALSPTANLDFVLSVSCAFDRPEILNPERPGYVSKEKILRNLAGYYSIGLGIALSF